MNRVDTTVITLTPEIGFELYNGETYGQKITLPLNSDISMWVEREIIIPEPVPFELYDPNNVFN